MSIEKLNVLITTELAAPGNTPSAIWYVAQCLEHDLATQARTIEELLTKELPEMILTWIAAGDPNLQPAPVETRARFEASIVRLELAPGVWTKPDARLPDLEIRVAA